MMGAQLGDMVGACRGVDVLGGCGAAVDDMSG
jgi:hypothetical protein